jgi:ubiquinone/menaquinone biosynthesis C-methylase UbiE
MTDFNQAARQWDSNNIHVQRSEALAKTLLVRIPLNNKMSALEFGAGTGILSFMLADTLGSIRMVDSASEMVAVMQEKVDALGSTNVHPMQLDLTKERYDGETFDLVFSQMAMHHVADTQAMLHTFHALLNKDGYLAIADLYQEDGSFHGAGFDGHNGFDVAELESQVLKAGFRSVATETSFTMKKGAVDYPIFWMIAQK